MRKALRNIIFLLNIIVALAMLIAYLSIYIPSDKIWIISLFGLAYPGLLILNLLFIAFWTIIRPRFMFLSISVILTGAGIINRYFQFTSKSKEAENGIKVISYNIRNFEGNGRDNQQDNAKDIVKFLQDEQADIICLQEVRLRKNKIFNLGKTVRELKSINHYQYARSSTTHGSVTMTRYPIVYMGEIRFQESRNMVIFTDMVIGSDTIRVYNVHLQSYMIDPKKYAVIDSPGENQEQDLEEVREMGAKFKRASQTRADQVRELRKHMSESPYKILLCGDFNDTPVSYTYQQLREGLVDAFVESGKGVGRTYIGKLPSFRIDNIFHDDSYKSYNFTTHPIQLSDHLPISCVLWKE